MRGLYEDSFLMTNLMMKMLVKDRRVMMMLLNLTGF